MPPHKISVFYKPKRIQIEFSEHNLCLGFLVMTEEVVSFNLGAAGAMTIGWEGGHLRLDLSCCKTHGTCDQPLKVSQLSE